MSVVLTFFALAHVVALVSSQDTRSASCVLASYHWAFNSAGASPCDVASSLLSVCQKQSSKVEALPEAMHYVGPSIAGANTCQCSTVTYSLLSACAGCQNRTVSYWSEWIANCRHVSVGSFEESIPEDVLVPSWAYLDVRSSDIFEPQKAKEGTDAKESSHPPSVPTQSSPPSPVPSTEADSSADSSAENYMSPAIIALFVMTFIIGIDTYLCVL